MSGVICARTEPSHGPTPWQCLRAAGHEGDCMWPVERAHGYAMSLADRDDPAWLRSEVRLLLTRIDALDRERREDDTPMRLGRVVGALIDLAPANAARKNVPLEQVRAIWNEAIS